MIFVCVCDIGVLKNTTNSEAEYVRWSKNRALSSTRNIFTLMQNVGDRKEAGFFGSFTKLLSAVMRVASSSVVFMYSATSFRKETAEHLRPSIVSIQAFLHSKHALVHRKLFSNLDISVLRLGTHSGQKCRVLHVFYDVHNEVCTELFVILVVEQRGRFNECAHDIQKYEVTAHNYCHFICKRLQHVPISFASCYHVLSQNRMNENVLC